MNKTLLRFVSVLLSFVLLAFSVFAQNGNAQSDLMSLVEAERAFARTSVAKGIRDSFLEFFADDGVNFTPGPGNAKEFYGKRPAGLSPITLDWGPIYADISQAGDMGYTTGPYTVTSKEKQSVVGQGYYFSVWKKQADGSWKVAVDIGIRTPTFDSKQQPSFQAPPQTKNKKSRQTSLEAATKTLMELDNAFAKLSSTDKVQKAYLDRLSENARLHRNGLFPFVGKKAIGAFMSQNKILLKYEPIKSDVSKSGDIGYVYGSYEIKVLESSSLKDEKGYYIHVLKQGPNGKWKQVVEVINPLPAQ